MPAEKRAVRPASDRPGRRILQLCGDDRFAFETGLEHSQMIAVVTSFPHRGKVTSVRHLYRRIRRKLHQSFQSGADSQN